MAQYHELSDVGSTIGLNAALGISTQSARTVYLALLTSIPSDTTTLTTMAETTFTGYGRQAIQFGAPTGTPPTASNTNVVTFGPAGSNPPNITHFAIVSAASGTTGDFISHGEWATARDGASSDSLQVAVGGISIYID